MYGIIQNTSALEVECQFEEVYLDGSTQQGSFFFQQGMLRYQYSNPQLYTLIYDLERLYLVQNFNITTYQVIRDDKNIIELLKRVTDDFPNTQIKRSGKFLFVISQESLNEFCFIRVQKQVG